MSLVYLYCLLPVEDAPDTRDLAGLEDRPVRLVKVGSLQAAISEVGTEFGERQLNDRIRDLDWLSPRAVRHHEVVDTLFGRCSSALPLSFGAIFRSEDRLRRRLEGEMESLRARLERLRGRGEWDLKVTRDEEVFRRGLRIESAELGALQSQLEGLPPGRAFMLNKKIQLMETREGQRLSAQIRDEVHATLSELAEESRRDQLAAQRDNSGMRLEFRGGYLIEEAGGDGLKLAVGKLSARYASLGYAFDLTGPWPAFGFAGGLSEALA
ncbi:MAG: GvpL/GvpF family gas vesicle protein [Chloroflexi bacterium]|nr:GvpL/GvpF family gas vesicle protein [Chloroflexota bacterium]